MKNWRKIILFLGDALMLSIAGYLMLIVRFGTANAQSAINEHLHPFLIWGFVMFIILYVFNLYDATSLKPNLINLRKFLLALATGTISGIILFYFLSFPVAPKTNLLITQLFFAVLVFLWRRIFYFIFAKNFKNTIAFIGETPESKILIENIKQNPHIGYTYSGTFENLEELQKSQRNINTVVYVKNLDEMDLVRLSQSNYNYLDIRKAFQMILSRLPVTLIDDHMALKILEQKDNVLTKCIKKIIDIIFALLVIVITSPITILVVITMLIENKGPIFYTQIRTGYKGKNFSIIKFRSMQTNAESNGAKWADHNDSRITKTGAILRKTHIDEIPQMLNILRGDISLVGPRPERPEFVALLEKEIPYYFLRHTIKPGFTGWAQIKFRYARSIMDSQEKFEYDLFYIKNHNLLIDLGVIIKTIQIIVTH